MGESDPQSLAWLRSPWTQRFKSVGIWAGGGRREGMGPNCLGMLIEYIKAFC